MKKMSQSLSHPADRCTSRAPCNQCAHCDILGLPGDDVQRVGGRVSVYRALAQSQSQGNFEVRQAGISTQCRSSHEHIADEGERHLL